MNATMVANGTKAVPPVVSSIQDIPLAKLRESKTNPRRLFDEAKLAELADFVPRNKIGFLLHTPFCARRLGLPRRWRRLAPRWAHNFHSEQSHFIRSWSLRHPLVRRCVSELSTGGKQAVTAACFVRRLISAYR